MITYRGMWKMKSCWYQFHKPHSLHKTLSTTVAVLLHVTLNQTVHTCIPTAKNCCLCLHYKFCTPNGTWCVTTSKLNNYRKGALCDKFQLFLTWCFLFYHEIVNTFCRRCWKIISSHCQQTAWNADGHFQGGAESKMKQ